MAHGLARLGDTQQRLLRQLLLAAAGCPVDDLCRHLRYEAAPARHGGDWQFEAFNCVFLALARQHPRVCRFDLA